MKTDDVQLELFSAHEALAALKNLQEWVIRTHVGLNDLAVLKEATAVINKASANDNFQAWHETHYEVVNYFALCLEVNTHGKVREVQEAQGHGGLYELAEAWTNEFEALHKDHQWDGEFFDTIYEFLEKKNHER